MIIHKPTNTPLHLAGEKEKQQQTEGEKWNNWGQKVGGDSWR